MAWLVDFAEAPIPINLLSYAPFLGFFGFNFYSWLTILGRSPDFMNGLPLKVPAFDSSESGGVLPRHVLDFADFHRL